MTAVQSALSYTTGMHVREKHLNHSQLKNRVMKGAKMPYKATDSIKEKYAQVMNIADSDPALKQVIDQISTFDIDQDRFQFLIARVLNHLEIDDVLFKAKYEAAFVNYRETERQVDGGSEYLIAQYFLMDYARQKRGQP